MGDPGEVGTQDAELRTPPDQSRGSEARVNPPVVTIQTTPPATPGTLWNISETPLTQALVGHTPWWI